MTDFITIVSGLPRSGTSMMMQSIHAGGMDAMTDNLRTADDDNPMGYYEFEPVKKTSRDPSWLVDAGGRVVKMIYRLLYDLPLIGYEYRVVFMRRDISEVLASQKKMLGRLGNNSGDGDDGVGDEQMAKLFAKQLDDFDEWIAAQSAFSIINVNYKDMIHETAKQCDRVNNFLNNCLNTTAMVDVVDPNLYRNKK